MPALVRPSPRGVFYYYISPENMEGFTRQETIALTETNSNQLSYLDRTGLIIPQKYGNSKKPTIIYSWEQIIKIRAINNYSDKKQIRLQTANKIIEFFNKDEFDYYKDRRLVIINDKGYYIDKNFSNMPTAMKLADEENENLGSFVIIVIPKLSTIVKGIWNAAKNSEVIDFESFKYRAGAKPCT